MDYEVKQTVVKHATQVYSHAFINSILLFEVSTCRRILITRSQQAENKLSLQFPVWNQYFELVLKDGGIDSTGNRHGAEFSALTKVRIEVIYYMHGAVPDDK